MSYDLYFWRETEPQRGSSEEVCDLLFQDYELPGIEHLPVAQIKERFRIAFPEIDDAGTQLDWEGSASYFQASWAIGSRPGYTMAVSVCCGYNLLESPETMNRILSVMQGFGCALYDPQIGQRYDQPEPTVTSQ